MDEQRGLKRTPNVLIAVGAMAVLVAGCTSTPTNYAATFSVQDPKWQSPQCQEIRAEATNYKEQNVSFAGGALLGPYGLAIAAAGKEHQQKKRLQIAREMLKSAIAQGASGRPDGQAEKQL